MKKVKYLSFAVALAALSSCSSDDLNLGGGRVELATDGSEVYATVVDVEEIHTNRAGFAVDAKPGTQNMGQLCLFEEGDQFKMYCSDTWKPQVYQFKQMAGISAASGTGTTAVFEYAEPGSAYNKADSEKNREYGVFPADMFKFNDEYRKELVFELPTENIYGTFTPSTAGAELTGRGEMSAWHALVPMFGIYKPTTSTIGFYYMTSLLRVQALGLETGKEHTLTLTSKKYKLSGTFTTDEFRSAEISVEAIENGDANVYEWLPTFDRTEAGEKDEQSITVKFNPTVSDVVLYLPLPTGEYETDDLTLTLDNTDITDAITYREGTSGNYVYTPLSEVEGALTLERGVTGTNLYAIVENNAVAEVTTLKEINDLLKELAETYDRDVTVDVNIKGNGIVVYDKDSEKDEYRKLMVPELPYNVTLNINGKITADEGKKLNIIGGGGEGALTINYLYNDEQTDFAPIAIEENFANDVVLTAGSKDGKYVKFGGLTAENMAGNLTLAGMFANVETVSVAGTLTLKDYIYHCGGGWTDDNQVVTFDAKDVTIEGDCSKAAFTYQTYPNTLVLQEYEKDGKKCYRTVTFDFGAESTVTFADGAKVYGVKAGTVAVTDKYEISAVETSVSLTITDAQVDAVTLNGGIATIDAKDKTVNTLTLNAPAIINLDNGIINTISKSYVYDKDGKDDGTKEVATVNSTGKSAIGKVENVGNWINFYSKWTGLANADRVDVATQLQDNNIYTANQFMARNSGPMTLYADIDFDGIAYQRFHMLQLSLEGVVRDNGTTTTLKNLKLVKPSGYMNIGLYAATSVGYGTVTVKNIHIENVSTDFNEEKVENVGVLFGKVTRNLNIENVVVKKASLTCSDASSNIGGLIGYVEAGKVSVVNTEVDANIEGYYNLGGVIGSVAKDAEVTFGKTKNVAAEGVKAGGTTIKVVKDMSDEKDANAGKVGLAVGELNGKLSLQYFTATWAANNAIDDLKYDKCRFFINDNTMVFKGCKNGSNIRYYVGYSPAAQEFKLQENEMVNGYDGETYNDKGTFNIFEKLNK